MDMVIELKNEQLYPTHICTATDSWLIDLNNLIRDFVQPFSLPPYLFIFLARPYTAPTRSHLAFK